MYAKLKKAVEILSKPEWSSVGGRQVSTIAQADPLLEQLGYKRKARDIGEVEKYGGELYKRIVDEIGGWDLEYDFAYFGDEHRPDDLSTKLPNITFLPSLRMRQGDSQSYIYGSTMGHTHTLPDLPIQEVYEFKGYGAMLLAPSDELDSVRFYVARPGSKVVVPSECIMTIANLSQNPLLTIDMANPEQNESTKEVMEKIGPMFVMYRAEGTKGAKIVLNSQYSHFGLENDAVIELPGFEGEGLVDGLFRRSAELDKYNIELVNANSTVVVTDSNGTRHTLDRPLEELVVDAKKPIHRILGMVD